MSRSPKKPDPRQLSFDGYFEIPKAPSHNPGALNFDSRLRAWLTRAIKESGKPRAEVAAMMTELLFGDDDESRITRVQIDAWTGASRDAWRFPLAYLPAFVTATGAFWLLDNVASLCGCRALVGEDALFAEYGRLDALEREVKSRKEVIRKRLPKEPRR